MLPHWMRLTGAMLAMLIGLAYWQRPDGMAHLFFIETAGDAFLMVTPSGKHLLIDGGSDPAALTTAMGRLMPFWKREIDAVILTRADQAHAAGQVAALARYHVRQAFAPRYRKADAVMQEWQRQLAQQGTPVRTIGDGAQLTIDRVQVRVLAGANPESGLALWMGYGKTSVLLAHSSAAGVPVPSLGRGVELIAYPWQLDLREGGIAALRPRAIVFTDGVRVDAPALLPMDERSIGQAALYHEGLNGLITWSSDGRRGVVAVERHYCASISLSAWAALFAATQRSSASCSSFDRS